MEKELLIDKKLIKDAFKFDYLDEEIINVYRYFEDYFKTRFDDYAKIFNIDNYCFYISNDIKCNAFARKEDIYNIIGITNSYPILLKQKFNKENFKNMILIGLINDIILSDSFVDLMDDTNFEVDKFFINCSMTFTFSHEFQHVLQQNYDHNICKTYNFQEQLFDEIFDIRKHVWEFDADRMASYEVLKYAYKIYSKLRKKSDGKLTALIFTACASMIITKYLFYFGIINQVNPPFIKKKVKFYLKEKSHPHALVRCFNIMEYFFENVTNDFPKLQIDFQQLFTNVLGISKIFFDSLLPRQNAIDLLFSDMNLHLNDINQYNQELYGLAIRDEAIRRILLLRKIDY